VRITKQLNRAKKNLQITKGELRERQGNRVDDSIHSIVGLPTQYQVGLTNRWFRIRPKRPLKTSKGII